jgi:glucan biosynthesis protein C
MSERKYYFDWLRVIAMLCVFVFHCTRFFDNEGWHLKAPLAQQNDILGTARGLVLWVWLMELFFLAAGFATFYALRSRSPVQYLLERVKRLLVPLYTVGMFILVVPQFYFELFSHGTITLTFWKWLPDFYRGLPGSLLPANPLISPVNLVPYTFSGHLWFIQMLFLISLVFLPLILLLRSAHGQRFVARLAGWAARPGGIFLFVIPLALARVALNWLPMHSDHTWGDFLWYGFYFVIGFIIAGDERFVESMKKYTWLCLGLWIVLFVGVGGALQFALNANLDRGHGLSLVYAIWQVAYSVVSWSSIVFLVSLGAQHLNFPNRFLAYSNEAVLPFYIFHQTIILIVGWFVLTWQIGTLAKFAIIAAISFPVIMILYEGLVRHIGFMRFLFGMAPLKKQPAMPRPATPVPTKM